MAVRIIPQLVLHLLPQLLPLCLSCRECGPNCRVCLLSHPDQTPQNGGTDLQAKVASLQSRILKERKMLEGYQAMRQATTNSDVIRACESKIRESGKTIGWFEESLRDLESRMNGTGTGGMGGSGSSSQSRTAGKALGEEDPRMRTLPPPPPGAAAGYVGQNQYGPPGSSQLPSGGSGSGGEVAVRPKVTYTSLGEFLETACTAVVILLRMGRILRSNGVLFFFGC